jgi:chromosome transmission fidelity protein 1
MCNIIPDGVVAFFPSYEYLNQVIGCWKKDLAETNDSSIFKEIEKKKAIFHESADRGTNTEDLLHRYSSAIDTGTGALLLSVMGGKLSEGINFSDRLGRGVIVVGLPFPNIRSPVLQAKIKHVEHKAYEACPSGSEESKRAHGKTAGQEFYENSCMRTVNQCIGRAIRHQNDYAVILMLDRRYSTPRIRKKLPMWIQESLAYEGQQPTRRTIGSVASFFHKKKALGGAK